MKRSFFEDVNGNKSSSRLITFIVIIVALLDVNVILWFGRENVMIAATAAGTFFGTVAGASLFWMYNQKKNENK